MRVTKSYFVASLVLYAAAIIFLLFAIWACVEVATEIKQVQDEIALYQSYGEAVDELTLYTIVRYYFSSCGIYLAYALIMAGLGLLLYRKDTELNLEAILEAEDDEDEQKKQSKSDKEIDEWFEEMENLEDNSKSEKEEE